MSIYVPARSVEDWRLLLAEPDKQWRSGFSAKTLAQCWQAAAGFPACVLKAFRNSGLTQFQNIELLLAIPEHRSKDLGSRLESRLLFWPGRRTRAVARSHRAVADGVARPDSIVSLLATRQKTKPTGVGVLFHSRTTKRGEPFLRNCTLS